ncbi:MAG: hypothetical protein JNL92_23345 [Opitutaceae bacterium]|nr:hypothetical protein [Opitutaceae bacterium]
MFASFQRRWKELARGKPGQRFQRRFENQSRSGSNTGWRRVMNLVLALACFAVGVVLVFIPGPAVLFFFIGGGLLATESRVVAALLDAAELRIRKFASWVHRQWVNLSAVGKAAVGSLFGGAAFGCAYLSYRVFVAE